MSTAYCTIADLTIRYGALPLLQASDREGDGVVNTDLVASACSDASELIDGYVGERYTLPLSPVSGIVIGWACAIAWFKLQFAPRDADREAYEDALADLERVRVGKIVLQANGVPQAGVPVEGDVISVSGAPRVFSADSLRGY